MNTAPCFNCADREYLCHSTCKKYIDFKQWKDEMSKKRRKENELNHIVVESIERLHGKKGRHQRKRQGGTYDKYE